jgi:hypothetical protein
MEACIANTASLSLQEILTSKNLTAGQNPSCNIMYSQGAELPCFRRKIANFYAINFYAVSSLKWDVWQLHL